MIIFWFRNDLRLTDNPALSAAAKKGEIMPIYIIDSSRRQVGKASKWWLHHALSDLNKQLDNKLNIYQGDPKTILTDLRKRYEVTATYSNRCYEPNAYQDEDITLFNGTLLWEPEKVLKPDKTPYKVYTPFNKACLKAEEPRHPLKATSNLALIKDKENKTTIEDLLLNKEKLSYEFTPTTEGATQQLTDFLDHNLKGYKTNRNLPALDHSSKLAPYMHFGQISPNQIWYAASSHALIHKINPQDTMQFLNEIIWREFNYYLLHHFPHITNSSFRPEFDNFPWQHNEEHFKAWQQGMTGYPIIDAGMRQLNETGYMHNRVRMIVASFLIKNLLIDWRYGEQWFWEHLLDADLANNICNWQWVAGSGADAAPYFRIFNPILQTEKFDKDGEYIKLYVPELKELPAKYIANPSQAPEMVLKMTNIKLGKDYPLPIVDLETSRNRALAAYKQMNNDKSV